MSKGAVFEIAVEWGIKVYSACPMNVLMHHRHLKAVWVVTYSIKTTTMKCVCPSAQNYPWTSPSMTQLAPQSLRVHHILMALRVDRLARQGVVSLLTLIEHRTRGRCCTYLSPV